MTSIPLNSAVTPSPKGTLAPAVSYKLIKLDQTDSADATPKFMLAGQDNNDPLLPVTEKSLKNRKVLHPKCFQVVHSHGGIYHRDFRCQDGTCCVAHGSAPCDHEFVLEDTASGYHVTITSYHIILYAILRLRQCL